MNKKIQFLSFTALFLFLITTCLSCSGGGGNDAPVPVTPGPVIQTISWQADADGFLQYSTNDPSLYSTAHHHTNNTIQTTMYSVEAQVKKNSGNAHEGYGIFFCYQDSGNFYRILITINGYYVIAKRVSGIIYHYASGSWTTANPSWPTSSNLITGYGNINDIKVANTGGGTFDVYFNGTLETTFTDSTFTGGDSGYYAVVGDSSLENFPTTPADLRFKQIDPDLSTANSVQRILWQNDGAGFVQFSTNDTNDSGYLFTHAIGSPFTPMSSIEIQVKKMTGSSHYGDGIVFCYQDQNNYYGIRTTVNRYYEIYKRVSGIYSYNTGGSTWYSTQPSWPTSILLNPGYDTINDIKVISNGSGTYDLYFNGTKETSFTDSTFTGGYNGYVAIVGKVSDESFPTPVDVRFKFIAAN